VRTRSVTMFMLSLVIVATPAAEAADATKEDLVKSLTCKPGQEACEAPPPPVSHRRGFSPPPARRGITFEPFTEEGRKNLDDAAKAGKLPSADLEVYFDYDKADVTELARKSLGPLGQALNDPKLIENRFILVGHTDAKGGDAYNQALSERRAAAVKEFLVRSFGIAPERLVSYGRGKSALKNSSDPLAPENRRVQVINNGVMAGAERKP
jgi:outer membrane protein OmpA-like peptidoglycan-associated protein